MYTRDFQMGTDDGLVVPEKYSGIAFGDERNAPSLHNEEAAERETETEKESVSAFNLFSGLSKFLPGKLFDGKSMSFFKNGFKSLGTEELLLLALAAFLFFSKDGDKECAIMLLLVLFLS